MPAAAANEECRCTSQFEGVVYSNIVVAGLASNMTRGKSQTSVAHVVYDRARTHSTQECRHALHDEIVGVGPLCQLGYNEMPREEAYLRGLMQSLGVPSSLTEIGIEPTEETRRLSSKRLWFPVTTRERAWMIWLARAAPFTRWWPSLRWSNSRNQPMSICQGYM